MGSARKSALFNPKVTTHQEDLELTRRIILNHIAQENTVVNVVSTAERTVDAVEAVEVPALASVTPSEDENDIEVVESSSSSSSSRRRKFLSTTAALSSLSQITSTFITTSKFLKVMPSLKGKIIRAVKKTGTTSANVAGGVNSAASMTLRLTDRGVKNVFAAAGSVVDWAVPTSLNLGDTSSTYRITTTSAARRRAGTSGSSSSSRSSILPLSFQLGNIKTMNRVVKEMVFLLQQM